MTSLLAFSVTHIS